MITFELEYKDGATPLAMALQKQMPRWKQSALKSTGFMLRKMIRDGIQSKAPGGASYKPLAITGKTRRSIEQNLHSGGKSRYILMGKLKQAVEYSGKTAAMGYVKVGWLSPSSAELGKKLQEGFESAVTPRIRRAYAAAGIVLSSRKKKFRTPARPTFDPMIAALHRAAVKNFNEKITSYINGNTERSQSRLARYR